jgi:predicted dehydrogenase
MAALGTSALLSPRSWGQVAGANNAVRIGVVGIRGRGRGAINVFRNLPGVRVTALCDVDSEILAREKAEFTKRGQTVETYADIRLLLESKNVDAIAVGAPNHWHSLMGIWACEAGKDAYIEKPISHNVWEGRQLVRAAAKYNRVIQGGTQFRSDPGVIAAVEFVRAGNLGRIKCARGFAYFLRESLGKVSGPQQPPASVDYDLWTGPAELQPLMRASLHKDWHFVWNTGNGELCNMGVHEMDICRWFLGEEQIAPRIMSIGGRFGFVDDGQTPNSQVVICEYAKAPVIFEVRGLPAKTGAAEVDKYRGVDIGVVIECEDGYITWGRGGGAAFDRRDQRLKEFVGNRGKDHHQNFIDAVRTRDPAALRCPPITGHLAASICHIGNISHRVGTARTTPEMRERISAHPRFAEAWNRMEEHLALNNVNLAATPATLGPMLNFDAATEQFTGDFAMEAGPLLTRHYRPGFEVKPV